MEIYQWGSGETLLLLSWMGCFTNNVVAVESPQRERDAQSHETEKVWLPIA